MGYWVCIKIFRNYSNFFPKMLREMRFLSYKSHVAFNDRARSPRSNDTGEGFCRQADAFFGGKHFGAKSRNDSRSELFALLLKMHEA